MCTLDDNTRHILDLSEVKQTLPIWRNNMLVFVKKANKLKYYGLLL